MPDELAAVGSVYWGMNWVFEDDHMERVAGLISEDASSYVSDNWGFWVPDDVGSWVSDNINIGSLSSLVPENVGNFVGRVLEWMPDKEKGMMLMTLSLVTRQSLDAFPDIQAIIYVENIKRTLEELDISPQEWTTRVNACMYEMTESCY